MKKLFGLNFLLSTIFLLISNPTFAAPRTDKNEKAEYYDLRVYTIQTEQQLKLIDDYWARAAIPALKRLGCGPIGVFTELDTPEITKVYVLIPYPNLEAFAQAPARLAADSAYQKAGASYLNAPKSDPAYVRFESSLLVAFDGMKHLEVPQSPKSGKPWVFELRTYESHSEAKGMNKVKMFNSGEIPLMHEVNLGPVFFGQALSGSQLPKLVYMVSGENKDEHQKHWKGFFAAPVWKQLSADQGYSGNVSKVVSTFLKRLPSSQI
jgi:hypothetical protein